MDKLKFANMKISNGISIIILSSLTLVACGGGSAGGYTPASSSAGGTSPTSPSGPAISLSATPALVAYNGTALITWSSPGSNSCSSSPTGINSTSGTYTTPQLKANTSYIVTCVGASGTSSKSVSIIVAPSSIVTVVAGWVAEPVRSGTVHYYCDCGTGASGSCVPGSNANTGLSSSVPKQTIADAISTLNSMPSGDTVAMCKGGAFNAAGQLTISTNCAAGSTCKDLREYTPPTFAGTAKPIINSAPGARLFSLINSGGVRLLNFKLQGNYGGGTSWAFFFYNAAHDVTMGNLDIDGFDMAIDNESGSTSGGINTNIKLSGSKITRSMYMGYLGGGNNTEINYNYWDANGSDTVFDHTIYVGSHIPLTNIQIVGNYIHGQSSPTCLGAPIVGHLEVNGLEVSGNTVDIDAAATTPGCWGIAFDNGGYPTAISLRNARFSGNTIKNGGNTALTVANCPDCVIENNLIVNETAMSGTGISIPNYAARTSPVDGVSTRNLVRNNTIWYGPNATSGGVGIRVRTEGTGHVIANNSVYYSAISTGSSGPFNCFHYPLAQGSYAFINNNQCYSAASYNWEATSGTLAAWRAAAPGFDTMSFFGNPMYKAAGTDFTPDTGSPLIATGNSTQGSLSDINGKARTNPPAIGAFEPL